MRRELNLNRPFHGGRALVSFFRRCRGKPIDMTDHHDSTPNPGHEMKDADLNLAFIGELVTLTARKITWATAGLVTDPGRYMFRFGWLTITADDLAIWRAYPNAAFTLIRTLTSPRAETDDEAVGEDYRLGTFDLRAASTHSAGEK